MAETIQTLEERCARLRRLKTARVRAGEQLARSKERMRELREALASEREDVERLEGLSLAALFHTVLMNKQERLAKEREEVLRAKLRLDEGRAGEAALRDEVARIDLEIEELGDPDSALVEALARLEGRLRGSGDPRSARLTEIGGDVLTVRAELVQVGEAIASGILCRDRLGSVLTSLSKAESWGTFDMFAGGLVTTAIKHGHMDKARGLVSAAQAELARFSRELQDVDLVTAAQIDVDGFLSFADYFFDGLIVDWMVQSKIVKTRTRVADAATQVRITLGILHERREGLLERLDELEDERRTLLRDAEPPR